MAHDIVLSLDCEAGLALVAHVRDRSRIERMVRVLARLAKVDGNTALSDVDSARVRLCRGIENDSDEMVKSG